MIILIDGTTRIMKFKVHFLNNFGKPETREYLKTKRQHKFQNDGLEAFLLKSEEKKVRLYKNVYIFPPKY